MHNCKETRERVTELVLDGRSDESLAAELRLCPECRTEFAALNATLRMTVRASEIAAPAESYWNGYHARLREKLAMIGPEPSRAKPQRRGEKLGPLFATRWLCVRSSVRIPVPLGLAVIILCVALGTFALRRTKQPAAPLVVQVPIAVPVVQERVVTRVVYRDRYLPARDSRRVIKDARAESTFARSRKQPTEEVPVSLTGFKPTEEIKLTVIKGGVPNEQ